MLAGSKRIYTAVNRTQTLAAFNRWNNRWIQQYPRAVRYLEKDLESLLTFLDLPHTMRRHIRITSMIERSFKEVRRRTRPI